jgi:hypothetical protein
VQNISFTLIAKNRIAPVVHGCKQQTIKGIALWQRSRLACSGCFPLFVSADERRGRLADGVACPAHRGAKMLAHVSIYTNRPAASERAPAKEPARGKCGYWAGNSSSSRTGLGANGSVKGGSRAHCPDSALYGRSSHFGENTPSGFAGRRAVSGTAVFQAELSVSFCRAVVSNSLFSSVWEPVLHGRFPTLQPVPSSIAASDRAVPERRQRESPR